MFSHVVVLRGAVPVHVHVVVTQVFLLDFLPRNAFADLELLLTRIIRNKFALKMP